MRYATGDLAVLSAEVYDPGDGSMAPEDPAARNKAPRPATRDGRRKRKVPSPGAEQEQLEEDDKKKVRGRPRLETKDETAAERRRTQIRLAQRAYRNRKDNAIQTLEKRVQDLEGTNEEMSNAIKKLQELAASHGMLQREPEFARQLQDTTRLILSLKSTPTLDVEEDQITGSSGSGGTDTGQQTRPTKSRKRKAATTATGIETAEPPEHPSDGPLYAGIVVSHELAPENELVPPQAAPDPLPDYEVVTYPTLNNASFPLGTGFNFDGTEAFAAPNPFATLPMPRSYAAMEATFGRRLHRVAVERALILIDMPNPPPTRFARVFGFCALFESQESIRNRLHVALNRTRQESLYNWNFPFLQLGGAGTHFQPEEYPDSPLGNRHTTQIGKPKIGSAFGIGPYDSKVVEAGTLLDGDCRINLPELRADFYDCDEVELYLRNRGVIIPDGADYVSALVDPRDFDMTEQNPGTGSMGKASAALASMGVLPEIASHTETEPTATPSDLDALLNMTGSSIDTQSTSSGDQSTAVTVPAAEKESAQPWNMIPNPDAPLDGLFTDMSYGFEPAPAATGYEQSNMFVYSGMGAPEASDSAPQQRLVSLDVNMFIFAMIERAACMGRTPGIRKADINTAFALSARGL